MSDSPPVSVVIAAYNGARFIEETLAACLDQSDPPAEVIVVDDASTDDTVARIERLQSPYTPVRLLRRLCNSGGPPLPYNQGIAVASSPLVALLDQDDIWHRDKLQQCRVAFARRPEAGLVYTDCLAFTDEAPSRTTLVGDAEPVHVLPRCEAMRRALAGQFTWTMSNMVLRKATWRQVGGFPAQFRISTDYAFLARVVSAGIPIAHLPSPLVFYRVSPNSVWSKSEYLLRHRERYYTVDFLCRRFAGPQVGLVRQRLGGQLYDLADQAARRGAFGQALLYYAWSVTHQQPPWRVLRAAARTAVKWVFGR